MTALLYRCVRSTSWGPGSHSDIRKYGREILAINSSGGKSTSSLAMHQACFSHLGPVNATIQTRTPIFHPTAASSRQLYEPCVPSSSGRSVPRSVRASVQAPAKSGGGDWSSRLLAATKKKKEPKSPEDIFQPKRPAGFTEFGDEDGEEEEGPSAKRLPAEMRCAP